MLVLPCCAPHPCSLVRARAFSAASPRPPTLRCLPELWLARQPACVHATRPILTSAVHANDPTAAAPFIPRAFARCASMLFLNTYSYVSTPGELRWGRGARDASCERRACGSFPAPAACHSFYVYN